MTGPCLCGDPYCFACFGYMKGQEMFTKGQEMFTELFVVLTYDGEWKLYRDIDPPENAQKVIRLEIEVDDQFNIIPDERIAVTPEIHWREMETIE